MPRRRDGGLRQHGFAQAPAQARPLVDFDTLNRGIDAMLLDAGKFMGKFSQIPEVKRTSKLWPLVRHPRKSKLVGGGYESGWLLFHPLRVLGKIFMAQKGDWSKKEKGVWQQPGIFASRKEKTRMAAARAWRTESGVEGKMQKARKLLENSMRAAASELRQKVETGAVRPDNVGEHIGIYNTAVSKAWLQFQGEITGILKQFRDGWKEDDGRVVKGALYRGITPRKADYIK